MFIGSPLIQSLKVFLCGLALQIILSALSTHVHKIGKSKVMLGYLFNLPTYLVVSIVTVCLSLITYFSALGRPIIPDSMTGLLHFATIVGVILITTFIVLIEEGILFFAPLMMEYKISSSIEKKYEKLGYEVLDERLERAKRKEKEDETAH